MCEMEQVDTVRAAAPADVIAKVPMGSSKANVYIRGGHMAKLRQVPEPMPTGQEAEYYLHDEVIDAYMFYLQQRESNTGLYDCTFYTRLLAKKGNKSFRHYSVPARSRAGEETQTEGTYSAMTGPSYL